MKSRTVIAAETRAPVSPEASSVHELLQFERLMSELSAGFINLPVPQIDGAIVDGLRRIVETLGIERSSLTLLVPGTDRLQTTHSWATEGLPPVLGNVWPEEDFSFLVALGRARKPLVFSSLGDLPPAAESARLAYQRMGLRSHVAQPLIVGGELLGFLGFGSLRRERAWPEDLLARMRLLAEIFASALARKRAQAELDRALGFERLATRILASLLLAEPRDEDAVIELALRDIAKFLDVERITLWERIPGRTDFRRTHRWIDEGLRIPAERSGAIDMTWISVRLVAGEVVRIARLSELPADAGVDRGALHALGVRSLLAVPISASGDVVGALAVAAVREERDWPLELLPGLRLLAEVFASLHLRNSVERQKRVAEAEAAQWRERLAHLVRVHTVGEMSAALAHEITQPLGAIENYARAAVRRASQSSPDLAKVTELLEKVIGQAIRAGDVVMRLRGLVKRHDLDPVRIAVDRTVRACVDMVKLDCELRDIHIDVKPTQELPEVVADEIHVQQVIINLLRNAMDAMSAAAPDAPRVITIETERSGPDAVVVSVADHGPGVPAGDLERVFESFYSTKAEGLGIGLAICRKLVEAHGGALWATHNPGGGAVFQFTLPVRAAES